jgi:DnaK suppressor protein
VNPDHARELLTAELAELDERAAFAGRTREEASADTLGQEAAMGQHPGDYGTEVATTMEAELMVDTVGAQRRRIEAALARLDDGSYGRCAVCGKEIDDERLEARPEADTCREHADTPTTP